MNEFVICLKEKSSIVSKPRQKELQECESDDPHCIIRVVVSGKTLQYTPEIPHTEDLFQIESGNTVEFRIQEESCPSLNKDYQWNHIRLHNELPGVKRLCEDSTLRSFKFDKGPVKTKMDWIFNQRNDVLIWDPQMQVDPDSPAHSSQ